MQLPTYPAHPCFLPFQARLFSEVVVCFRFLIAAIPHYLLLLCVLHVCILSLTFKAEKYSNVFLTTSTRKKTISQTKYGVYGKREIRS